MDASIIKPFVDATSQFADCHFCAGLSNLPRNSLALQSFEGSRSWHENHGKSCKTSTETLKTSDKRHKWFIKSQNTAQLRGSNWSHRSLQRLQSDGAGMQMYSSAAGTPGKIQSNWSSHVFADVRASCLTNWSKVLEILDRYLYFWLWFWANPNTFCRPFQEFVVGFHQPPTRT